MYIGNIEDLTEHSRFKKMLYDIPMYIGPNANIHIHSDRNNNNVYIY